MKTEPTFIDGYYGTPVPTSTAPLLKRPFKESIPPDVHARTLERRSLVDPRAHSPRLATRTSYTNYLTYSEDFSNAAWTLGDLTRTAAARANPWDGTSTFSKFLEAATTASHHITRNYTFTAVPHTLRALVAPELSRSYVRLAVTDGVTTFIAFFNIVDGVVHGTPSNCTAAIKRYADGSCRVSITFTPIAVLGTFYVQPSTDGSTISYLGDVTKGFYCGGVQIERASSAGPYIVTTSAERTVSVPDVDGIYNSALIDPDDFAFHVAESDVDTDATPAAPLSRTYARVPRRQIVGDSRWIDRPALDGTYASSGTAAWAVCFDERKKFSHIFLAAARKAVSSLSTPDAPAGTELATAKALPAATVTVGKNAGGTFTFSTSDSAATIQAAFASAFGSSSYASKGDGSISINGASLAIKYADVSGTGVEMSLSGSISSDQQLDLRATSQNAASIRTINATGHGGVVGDRAALWAENALYGTGIVISKTTDAFTVELDVAPGKDLTVTHCGFATDASYCVVNGAVEADIEIVTDFYLLGFTILSGGTTCSLRTDIPNVTVQMDPVSWLIALVAYLASPSNTAYVTESPQGKKQWMGDIIAHTWTRVQLADVVDSITP